jgi:copper transport protein
LFWRTALVAGAASALIVASAPPAAAHAFLVSTTPAAGARLDRAPTELVLAFSEAPSSYTAELRDSDGEPIVLPSSRADGPTLTVALPALSDGVYLVGWHAIADDGHESAGEFAFGVGATEASLPAAHATTTTTDTLGAVGAFLFLAGLCLALGGLASEQFLRPQPLGDAEPRAPIRIGIAVALAGTALRAGHLSAEAGGAALSARPGVLLLVGGALLAYALWIVTVTQRVRGIALVPLAGAALAAGYQGHAGDSGWWAGLANGVHVLAAASWIGALAHLVIGLARGAGRSARLSDSVHRYAAFAIWTVPLLLVAGTISALGEFDRIGELTDTRYGRVLLVKISVVAIALLFAAIARRRGAPRPGELRPPVLRMATRLELGALAVVLGVSALLGATAPPLPAIPLATVLGPPPLRGAVVRAADRPADIAVFVATDGRELRVELFAPDDQLRDATVTVEGRRADDGTFTLHPRPCGPTCFTMQMHWPTGTTTLEVDVHAPGWKGGRSEVELSWPPGGDATDELELIVGTMRVERELIVNEDETVGGLPPEPGGGYQLTGEQFIDQELYAAGGVTDVHAVPAPDGLRALVLFVPGSQMWQRLVYDDAGRLRRQSIVNRLHRIERSFEYPTG